LTDQVVIIASFLLAFKAVLLEGSEVAILSVATVKQLGRNNVLLGVLAGGATSVFIFLGVRQILLLLPEVLIDIGTGLVILYFSYRFLRGTRWSEERYLSQPGIYAGVPVVAPFGGRPYVLWYGIRPESPRAATRHASVYEILETHSAGPQWTPPVLISPGVPDSINPSLDVTADGHLHAAWFQFDARAYQIRTADFAGTWSRPRPLTAGQVDHTRVAVAADGRDVHLVWEEQTQPSRVMYLRLGSNAPVRLSGSGPARDPVIAAAGGLVAAVWTEGQSIVLRPLSPSGPSRVVGTGGGPSIAIDQGVAFVAWAYSTPSSSEVHFTAVRLR